MLLIFTILLLIIIYVFIKLIKETKYHYSNKKYESEGFGQASLHLCVIHQAGHLVVLHTAHQVASMLYA